MVDRSLSRRGGHRESSDERPWWQASGKPQHRRSLKGGSHEAQDGCQGWQASGKSQHRRSVTAGARDSLSSARGPLFIQSADTHQMTTTAFSRTFAQLLADRRGSSGWLIGAGAFLLGAWCWWAASAEMTLYEVSTAARVELDASTYPIQSPLPGRVIEADLRVGRIVRLGDVLVEMDVLPDELQLRQEQARARGIDPEVARLRSQIAAEEAARSEEQEAANLGAEEAGNRIEETETEARYADAQWARVGKLHAQGFISEQDLERARTDARRLVATVTTLHSTMRRVRQEQTTRDRERDVRIERLFSEIASLEAQRSTVEAGIERLRYEVERRRVRAPIDGTIGESASLRPGAVVEAGDRLASIVPSGRLLIAAQFPAARALGRIRAGQAAALRLDGFPWAEFGSVPATVARVGKEIRDGSVRVELTIEPRSGFHGTLEHGMPGSLEVAVERLSPLSLLLRTAGQALTAGR